VQAEIAASKTSAKGMTYTEHVARQSFVKQQSKLARRLSKIDPITRKRYDSFTRYSQFYPRSIFPFTPSFLSPGLPSDDLDFNKEVQTNALFVHFFEYGKLFAQIILQK